MSILDQLSRIKNEYPNSLALIQIGDFFESFNEDAKIISKELGITLTSKPLKNNIRYPLAGIPVKSLKNNIRNLLRKGYSIAICEQNPNKEVLDQDTGLVERKVTRVLSPGLIDDVDLLDASSPNYVSCIYESNSRFGYTEYALASADISTGKLKLTSIENYNLLISELLRLSPSEIFIYGCTDIYDKLKSQFNCKINRIDIIEDDIETQVKNRLNIASLDILGKDANQKAICLGLIYTILSKNNQQALEMLERPEIYSLDGYMYIDKTAHKDLEIFESNNEFGRSLFEIYNKTATSMGARYLRELFSRPLLSCEKINERLNAIEFFSTLTNDINEKIQKSLNRIIDLDRIFNKICSRGCVYADLHNFAESLIQSIKLIRLAVTCIPKNLDTCFPLLRIIQLDELLRLYNYIKERVISTETGQLVLNKNISKEYEELCDILTNSSNKLEALEDRERKRTGIKSLAIRPNRVFGYFIEIPKSSQSKVPPEYEVKQNLTNVTRYTTMELMQLQTTILNAKPSLEKLEHRLFESMQAHIKEYKNAIKQLTHTIAQLDVFHSLSLYFKEFNYIKPSISDNTNTLRIKGGMHPVVSTTIKNFVANDTEMTNDSRIIVLTGPNMSGKSTYMRQTALIQLLVQIGMYVPAKSVTTCIVDRIFTRVGASDSISTNISTFMNEMIDASLILNNATNRSLVIIDELGRGTSIVEGIAIAQSTLEYLIGIGCKVIFSTHYKELTQLESQYIGVKNYKVEVDVSEGKFKFLHKIVPGIAEKSYGIEIAKLAGYPDIVIDRARAIEQSYF